MKIAEYQQYRKTALPPNGLLLLGLCARAEPAFATPDDAVPRDRRTPHAWFPCRPLIRAFVARLAAAPRSLEHIAALGGLEDGHPLGVTLAQADA